VALQLWVPSVFIVVSVRCQPTVKCSRVSEAFRWSGEQQTHENIHEGNSLVMLYGAPSGKHTILVQYDNYDKPFEFEGRAGQANACFIGSRRWGHSIAERAEIAAISSTCVPMGSSHVHPVRQWPTYSP
jgi:hypothetical protein